MGCNSNRCVSAGDRGSIALLFAALLIGTALSFARQAAAGTPGTSGDATADRELGQIDFSHTTFDFGGPAAISGPAGVVVDSAGHLYVADSINNRVLGWTSASAFGDGDPANLVIGQPDFHSNRCDDGTAGGDAGGVGADSLCHPEGLAVDSAGNLYVADNRDNRVLEFDNPFLSGVTHGQMAAMVFGQGGSFIVSGCNAGGVGANSLCAPRAVTVDMAANLYVADSGNSRVLEYNTPLNAESGESGAGDTTADRVFGQHNSFTTQSCNDGTMAGDVAGRGPDSLCGPTGVASDAIGNLYVSDTNNSRVLEYSTPLNAASGETGAGDTTADNVFGQDGSFSTGADNDGTFAGDVAGLGRDSLAEPQGVALDSVGNLYVADAGNSRLLEYNTPLNAASGESGAGDALADLVFGQAGSFTAALCDGSDSGLLAGFGIVIDGGLLCSPSAVALDGMGNLYAADSDNGRLLVYNTPLDAAGSESGAGDAIADRELGQTDLAHNMDNFGGPAALELANPISTLVLAASPAIDTNGHLYVPDTTNSRVLGWASASAFADGAPAALVIGQPDFFSFACDAGAAIGDVNGVGPDSLCEPGAVAVDSTGNVYVADTSDNRVLEFAQPFASGKTAGQSAEKVFGQRGSFVTVAGASGADGLNAPTGVALDLAGDVFVADTDNNRVLEYDDPSAIGGGTPGVSGAAGDVTADLVFGQNSSFATAACNDGAAAGDVSGIGPDSLCKPTGVALDSNDNLYIADSVNSRVLEYNTPLNAGSGESGAGDSNADLVFGQNGSFTAAGCSRGGAEGDIGGVGADSLCQPTSVAVDSAGNLYVADTTDNRTLEYSAPLDAASGESGAGDAIADMVFGQATFVAKACAAATSADTLCTPNGVAVDSAKNLYIADSANSRVLEYDHPQASATPTPSPTASPTATPAATSTPTATASATPTASATATPSATATASATPTPTSTPMPSATPTALASSTPTPVATSSPTATPTPSPTPTPGGTLSVWSPVLFGRVGIGVAPLNKVVNIRNLNAHKTLTVSLSALSPPFAVVSGLGPFAIAPLHKTAVTIRFTPTAVGGASGSLHIISSDLHRPTFAVALFGRGATGTLALPAGVGLGQIGIGATPGSTTFAVRNSGIGMLTGSVGTLAAPFDVTAGGGAFNLAPGHQQMVTVQFTPLAAAHVSTTLPIVSDDPAHQIVNLAIGGSGAGGHLRVNLPAPLSPATLPTLEFGAVATSATSAKTFTVTNNGLGVLSGSVGPFAGGVPFSLTEGAGAFTLQPHQSMTIGVQFAPLVTGHATVTLTIADTVPGTPATVNILMAGRGS